METKLIKITDISADSEKIAEVGELLRGGGLAAIPTETVYGLAANALDAQAVKKIFAAKGRPQDNPLIVHIAQMSEVAPLVEETDSRLPALAEKFWPGALTVIMKKSALIPEVVSGGLDTVAIRMPSDPIANAIIRAAGVPLAAPSANSSGKPSPTTAKHVFEDMNGKIDAIVDGGKCEIGVESTVITLVGEKPRLLRPGGVTPEQLKEALGEIEIDKAVFSKLESGETAQSPGMKYKHYSPKAQITILRGSLENAARFVNSQGDESLCVLCFAHEAEHFNCRTVEYGERDNSLSQANDLFDALRRVDEIGCERAYVRCPSASGVGLAVYNRLLRAAAFKIVDADKKMPVIGLTGQTGAGKSTVCEYLAELGFYIIDGDLLAREAVKNKTVLADLALEFGEDVIKADGTLDRRRVADRAFASKEKTLALNRITHPAITALSSLELEKARACNARGAVIDAAALLESPIAPMCDLLACVTADREERIKRIINRDSITYEQALRRVSAQQNDEYYIKKTDINIKNGSSDDFREGVQELLCAVEALGGVK